MPAQLPEAVPVRKPPFQTHLAKLRLEQVGEAPLTPLPYDQGPSWAKLVSKLKQSHETGVGDTIHTQAGVFGEYFKTWAKKFGVPCGCDRRQAEYNARF